tara:strand:- start:460 stop:1152 length:693 start_codon:yes stop_codon:yes gene_type:complete
MLSIIIPVFNEKNSILKIIEKIENIEITKEIIIVDDYSSDGTREILKKINRENYKIFYHDKNLGKGAAIKTAKTHIRGDIVIIQDADLEYDPKDYKKLILPIINNQAEVVYGSRVLGKKRYFAKNFSSIYRIFFNHILTIISNFLNNQQLTDAHTCYKTFSYKVFNSIYLEENDFSFCPEVTTKISLKKIPIIEVPIEYYGRSYEEGKKIKLVDGVKALKTLIKYRFIKK